MTRKVHEKRVIGRVAWIGIPEYGIKRLYARVDTGAHHNTIHCRDMAVERLASGDVLSFVIVDTDKTHYGKRKIQPTKVSTSNFEEVEIRTSSGHEQKRFVVPFDIIVQGERYDGELFTLSDRSSMVFPALLGRRFLKGRYLVDAGQMVAINMKDKDK